MGWDEERGGRICKLCISFFFHGSCRIIFCSCFPPYLCSCNIVTWTIPSRARCRFCSRTVRCLVPSLDYHSLQVGPTVRSLHVETNCRRHTPSGPRLEDRQHWTRRRPRSRSRATPHSEVRAGSRARTVRASRADVGVGTGDASTLPYSLFLSHCPPPAHLLLPLPRDFISVPYLTSSRGKSQNPDPIAMSRLLHAFK